MCPLRSFQNSSTPPDEACRGAPCVIWIAQLMYKMGVPGDARNYLWHSTICWRHAVGLEISDVFPATRSSSSQTSEKKE